MTFRKHAAVILAGALMLSVISGCGSSTNKDEAATSQESTKQDTTTIAQESTQPEKLPPLKFSLLMQECDYSQKSLDINSDKWVLERNKRANVEISLQLVNESKAPELFLMRFASGDIPDVFFAAGDWRATFATGAVRGGLFMPLDELLEKNKDNLKNIYAYIPAKSWEEAVFEDGKIYGIPVDRYGKTNRQASYIRQDLLEKYQLQVPDTLDQWTEVLKAFKANGMKYPYTFVEKWSNSDLFVNPFGVSIARWNLNDKGEMIPDILRPEMKEALAYHRKLVEEGLLDPEAITTIKSVWDGKVKSGEIGAFSTTAMNYYLYNTPLSTNIQGAKYTLVPSPLGPHGARGAVAAPSVSGSWYINKSFKEPERMLQFLDFMASEAEREFWAYGSEEKSAFVYPTDAKGEEEVDWRTELGIFYDYTYNEFYLPYMPNGKEILDWFANVSGTEGYHAYKADGLKALEKYPDLRPTSCSLWQEYAAKIILGVLPVDAYDQFVSEYLKRGGTDLINEATETYKAGKALKY